MQEAQNPTPETTTLDSAAPAAALPAETVASPDFAAENQRLSAELDTLRGEHNALVRRTSMEGKVTDMNLALKVLDPEKHLQKDGTVDVYALYADYPSLAPTVTTPTAPNGGGGVQFYGPVDELSTAVQSGNPVTVNRAFDALLKGGRK